MVKTRTCSLQLTQPSSVSLISKSAHGTRRSSCHRLYFQWMLLSKVEWYIPNGKKVHLHLTQNERASTKGL